MPTKKYERNTSLTASMKMSPDSDEDEEDVFTDVLKKYCVRIFLLVSWLWLYLDPVVLVARVIPPHVSRRGRATKEGPCNRPREPVRNGRVRVPGSASREERFYDSTKRMAQAGRTRAFADDVKRNLAFWAALPLDACSTP